jgi:hypothetical protein
VLVVLSDWADIGSPQREGKTMANKTLFGAIYEELQEDTGAVFAVMLSTGKVIEGHLSLDREQLDYIKIHTGATNTTHPFYVSTSHVVYVQKKKT